MLCEFFEVPHGLAFRTLSGAQIDAEGFPITRGLCSDFCFAFCEGLKECGVTTTEQVWELVSTLSEAVPLRASSAFEGVLAAEGQLCYLAAVEAVTKDPRQQRKLFLMAGLLAVNAAISALNTKAMDADTVADPMVAVALAYVASHPNTLTPPAKFLALKRHAKTTLIRTKALDLYRNGGPWKSSRQAAKRICPEVVEYAHALGAPLSHDRAEQTVYDWIREHVRSSKRW